MEESNNLFNLQDVKKEAIKNTLIEVSESLKAKGYNAKNQITGYLMSGDVEYISNFQEAREKMVELNRADIIACLLEEFMK